MSKKAIIKVVILTILALIFWVVDALYLTPLITNNKPMQLIISMASFPVLLSMYLYIILIIWKNDKS